MNCNTELSDIEKYGIEVGDVWLLYNKAHVFIRQSDKDFALVFELKGASHTSYNVDKDYHFEKLLFRRGVVCHEYRI